MITNRGPLLISDTSININPIAKDLAKIAQMTSHTASLFGIQPKVAMLSYSNFGSSKNEDAQKVSKAVKLLHRFLPDIAVDGPIQADFAINKTMLTNKFPFSKIAGAMKSSIMLRRNLSSVRGRKEREYVDDFLLFLPKHLFFD